jgi:hypothetical protein
MDAGLLRIRAGGRWQGRLESLAARDLVEVLRARGHQPFWDGETVRLNNRPHGVRQRAGRRQRGVRSPVMGTTVP